MKKKKSFKGVHVVYIIETILAVAFVYLSYLKFYT